MQLNWSLMQAVDALGSFTVTLVRVMGLQASEIT